MINQNGKFVELSPTTAMIVEGEHQGEVVSLDNAYSSLNKIGRALFASEETISKAIIKAHNNQALVLCDVKRRDIMHIPAFIPVIIVDKSKNVRLTGLLQSVETSLKLSEVEKLYSADIIAEDCQEIATTFRQHRDDELKLVAFKIIGLHENQDFNLTKDIRFDRPQAPEYRSVPVNCSHKAVLHHKGNRYFPLQKI